jgi:hypothetical protein
MAQQHMGMAAMGGPVGGGPMGLPMSANPVIQTMTPELVVKKLNTAIYEYMICNERYEIARSILKSMPVETVDGSMKQSPKNHANGIDPTMDSDSKENINMKNRPDDLPAPASLFPSSDDHPFLQDWWCQFWDLWKGQRGAGKSNTLMYVATQRQAQKARQSLLGMDPNALQNGMRAAGMNGNIPDHLRVQAMRGGL